MAKFKVRSGEFLADTMQTCEIIFGERMFEKYFTTFLP